MKISKKRKSLLEKIMFSILLSVSAFQSAHDPVIYVLCAEKSE